MGCVRSARQRYGVNVIIDTVHGASTAKIRNYRLDENFYVLLDLPESYGEISFSVIWSKKNMNPALPMLLEFLVTK